MRKVRHLAGVTSPPTIFDPGRRVVRRRRALRLQRRPDAARFLLDEMVEDVLERLAFLRFVPGRVLAIGDLGELAAALAGAECEVSGVDPAAGFDLEEPFAVGGFDLVACPGFLDTVNDLPGALIHLRNALAPGGRVIGSFVGAGSLANLRRAMVAADAERPAARLHPLVGLRAAAALLQRAAWAEPVADSRTLRVAYRSLDRLVADLREQGLGNVLASPAPPLGKAALERARATFLEGADADGRVVESFEIITLSGRRSLRGT